MIFDGIFIYLLNASCCTNYSIEYHTGRLRSGSELCSGQSFNLCEGYARVRFDGLQADAGAPPETSYGTMPTAVRELRVDLGATCCRFLPGDKIRLQVCSAAHPKALRHIYISLSLSLYIYMYMPVINIHIIPTLD